MKVCFGPFTLDAATRQVTREDQPCHLSPKAFDLLCLLIEHRPAVVDKSSLRQQLWPETHVVDAALSNLVNEVRRVLADRPSAPAFIRTVHGHGYAFSGDARDIEAGASVGTPAASGDASPAPRCWLTWRQREFPLTARDHVIGRASSCAVWIDAPGVSRRHARVSMAGDADDRHAVLEDLESTNGTFLRGRRITHPARLVDGDEIGLGDASITFRAWRDADAPTKRVRRRRSHIRE